MLFLLWERYFNPTFQPCNINSTVNCNAVIWGEVSNTLGIPTPLIGLIGLLFILFGAFKKNAKLVLGMATSVWLFVFISLIANYSNSMLFARFVFYANST